MHPAVKVVKLGIPGEVQQINASLALALVNEHLKSLNLPVPEMAHETLPTEIIRGLENALWPGRCETRIDKDVTWYCDGAHTAESIAAATRWYSSLYSLVQTLSDFRSRSTPKMKILLFNQQTRNAKALLNTLASSCCVRFEKAIFCTNITFKDQKYKDGATLTVQRLIRSREYK